MCRLRSLRSNVPETGPPDHPLAAGPSKTCSSSVPVKVIHLMPGACSLEPQCVLLYGQDTTRSAAERSAAAAQYG